MSTPGHDSGGGQPSPAGPTTLAARALAPDLARGFMLLFIALANAHIYLYAREFTYRGYPAEGSGLDQIVSLFQLLLVDGRAYPMFSFLFGYGMVQLLRRQEARGVEWEPTRKLLRRRGWWMLLFGAIHGTLLFSGDIIGSYGLTALIFVALLRARDATLLIVSGGFLALAAISGLFQGMPDTKDTTFAMESVGESNPLLAIALRAGEWVGFVSWGQMLAIVPAAMLGIWAARRRMLDDPEQHRRALGVAAAAGLGVAVVGGLPFALMGSSLWTEPPAAVAMISGSLHLVSGYAGGVGWAAVVGLIAIGIQRRGTPDSVRAGTLSTAVAATGQRSLSCYLMQSVIFVPVFAPYAAGLGGTAGIAATSAIAAATWLLTVVIAELMRRAGHRGPAELALRQLTYRRPATSTSASS